MPCIGVEKRPAGRWRQRNERHADGRRRREVGMSDGWEKDMVRCVLNNLGECLAKTPEACLCQQMPKAVYEEARRALEGKE